MKHVKILNTSTLEDIMKKGGCDECQTSYQSTCKTSYIVRNRSCRNANHWSSVKRDTYRKLVINPYGRWDYRGFTMHRIWGL